MLLNFILGLLLPLPAGIYLYRKDKKILLCTFPFTSMIAFLINELGFYFGFWNVLPIIDGHKSFSALPLDMGLYPVLGTLMVYSIKLKNKNPFIVILLVALFTTLLEYLLVQVGRVTYGNGWNIFFTFFSYLIPYAVVYLYNILLERVIREP
ncbi:CBO0543 family protein [Ectobacillus panaciterrae]|uniref:CBO0543 family protein n=1 Tax=Ectobacillus panaciterrae TaxID=363872 RepID=UPI0003FE4EAF|nr:CBO0543 family protein [Ectobacillus panaciterrae]